MKAIHEGAVDINNQASFFAKVIKGFLSDMRERINIRGEAIPYVILNTGDDRMWLEYKGQDMSIEPLEVSNENGIYNAVPRCNVDMSNIEILEDQLTNPHIRGTFDLEHEDELFSIDAEFRRMPVKISVSLTYIIGSFTDMLEATQKIISSLAFLHTYQIEYMGQSICSGYRIPSSINGEKNIQFDGGTTENKHRLIRLDVEIESNLPVFEGRTAIVNNIGLIRELHHEIIVSGENA